jgi:hypothetical protein
MDDHWDWMLGDLALKGVDPRLWDLKQLLAAYEILLQQSAKDDAAWRRTRLKLYEEPAEVRRDRMAAIPRKGSRARATPAGMSMASVEGLLARVSAADAMYE